MHTARQLQHLVKQPLKAVFIKQILMLKADTKGNQIFSLTEFHGTISPHQLPQDSSSVLIKFILLLQHLLIILHCQFINFFTDTNILSIKF